MHHTCVVCFYCFSLDMSSPPLLFLPLSRISFSWFLLMWFVLGLFFGFFLELLFCLLILLSMRKFRRKTYIGDNFWIIGKYCFADFWLSEMLECSTVTYRRFVSNFQNMNKLCLDLSFSQYLVLYRLS